MSKGGPVGFVYVSVDKAMELDLFPGKKRKYYEKVAKNNGRCTVCGQHTWRYGQVDMCFPCTTGESDASDDYEIGDHYA